MNLIPSMLFPWFLAGAFAIALPIALHFLRRSPRGRTEFSSLMFVPTSPPTLTSRNRLDDWLLLLLRALALLLLAIAFARPFFRSSDTLDQVAASNRRVAVLVDRSASMRRGDLWQRAVEEAERAATQASAEADVAVYVYDDAVKVVVPFAETGGPQAAATHIRGVKQQLLEVGPTWGATDVSAALSSVADTMLAWQDRQRTQTALQIILISDMQEGSQQERLQAYEWPLQIPVDVRPIVPDVTANAGIQLLSSDNDLNPSPEQRVRVSNERESTREQFQLRWWSGTKPVGEPLAIYVPPGESRVVQISKPAPEMSVDRLAIAGDDCEFDNNQFVIPSEQRNVTVLYSGAGDLQDTKQMPYFLNLAMIDSQRRRLRMQLQPAAEQGPLAIDNETGLVVVSRALSADQIKQLHAYTADGGTVLFVIPDVRVAETLGALLEDPGVKLEEAAGDYAMLGQIDFEHALFTSFLGARYNDFTKIRFQRHRKFLASTTGNADVIARFDTGDPAVLVQRRGPGQVVILASGWHPADSQLALSSKFVPFLEGLLDNAGNASQTPVNWQIHDAIPVDGFSVVETPAGEEITLDSGVTHFDATFVPGIYQARLSDQTRHWSVNLAPSESRTAPIDRSALEQHGVQLGVTASREAELQRARQLRRTELESNQKVWRWAIVVAFGLLIVETWLASKPKLEPSPLGSAG